MSLLTDASLIVTPNGYNVNKLYSVIPNTTLGDMTVSRALSATRVNSAKFIEIARTNLLLRSEEFDNVVWNKGTGGSISPNSVISPIGTLTADAYTWPPSTTVFAYLSQPVSAISQNSNTFSIWLKRPLGSGSRTIRLSVSDVTLSTANSLTFTVTETWTRFEFTSASLNTTGSVGVGLYTGASGTSIAAGEILDVWGAQLEQSNAAATDYIPTTTVARTKFAGITQDGPYGANIPRIDYPPLGGCPSILLEPARTNLALYSEQFNNNVYWLPTAVTVTANTTTTTAPDGSFTADTVLANAVSSAHTVASDVISFTAGISYSLSVFAKKGTNDFVQLFLGAITGGMYANFDINTGVAGTVGKVGGTDPTPSITNFGNGWYRCTMNFTATTTNSNVVKFVIVSAANAAREESNLLGTSVILWGAQLEAGSTLTSYIPTTTATVLRNADVIKNTTATTLIGQTEGTMFVDVIGTKDRNASNKFILQISSPKSIHIAFYGTNINIYVIPNTPATIDLSVPFTSDVNYKIAVCYSNTGNFRVYINGFKYFEQNDYASGTFSLLNVGCTGTSAQLNSSIKSAVLWKTALTDDQCILLTGPSFSTYPEMANNFPNALIYTIQ